MSRSRKKTCISGATLCVSEKKDKIANHKRERMAVKQAIINGDELMPHYREVSDPWVMGKDGRFYFGNKPDLKHLKRK
jgi:hypothetical protein